MQSSISAKHHKINYQANPETGYFQKQPTEYPFQKLPYELKRERTQDAKIKCNGAHQVISGRIRNKKRAFFTGLIPCKFSGWFFGNNCEFINGNKVRSLIVFHFTEDHTQLTVYYFNRFYKDYPKERIKFVENFIEGIE